MQFILENASTVLLLACQEPAGTNAASSIMGNFSATDSIKSTFAAVFTLIKEFSASFASRLKAAKLFLAEPKARLDSAATAFRRFAPLFGAFQLDSRILQIIFSPPLFQGCALIAFAGFKGRSNFRQGLISKFDFLLNGRDFKIQARGSCAIGFPGGFKLVLLGFRTFNPNLGSAGGGVHARLLGGGQASGIAELKNS
jgi:hypothetical protein